MTEEEILQKISDLVARLGQGDVSLQDYGAEMAVLQDQLKVAQETKTQVVKEEEFPQQSVFEIASGQTPMMSAMEAEEYEKLTEKEKEEMAAGQIADLMRARAEGRMEEYLEPLKYSTGEFKEPAPPVGVSAIRDAQKGMVYDPETNTYRKAETVRIPLIGVETSPELMYEAMFRQTRATPSQKQMYEEQEAQARQDYIQGQLNLYRSQGMSDAEVEEKIYKDIDAYDTFSRKLGWQESAEGYIIETPLAWGLRMLNTGSALMAEPYKAITETMGAEPTGEVYKKGDVSQFATNVALGQGAFTAFLDYLPADAESAGVNILMQRDSPLMTGVALGMEMGIPITPVGVGVQSSKVLAKGLGATGKALKSPTVAKAAVFMESPAALTRLRVAEKEVEAALNAIEGTTPEARAVAQQRLQKIQKDAVAKGTYDSITVREMGAEAIGDVYAGNATLEKVAEDLQIAGRTTMKRSDVPVSESPYINTFFDQLGDEIELAKVLENTKAQDDILKGLKATEGGQNQALLRAYRITQDAKNARVENVRNGMPATKVSTDTGILYPKLKSSAIMNIDVDDLVKSTRFTDTEAARLKELYTKLNREALTIEEVAELDDLLRKDPNLLNNAIAKPNTLYRGTRGAVAEVVGDNLLKNIPEDYVYINREVAVPTRNMKSAAAQDVRGMTKELLDSKVEFDPTVGVHYTFTPEKAKRLRQYIEARGLRPQVYPEYQALAYAERGIASSENLITPVKMRRLESVIVGDLAKQKLGGIELKTGAMTAELAKIPEQLRGTVLFRQGRKYKTTNEIHARGIKNAFAILGGQRFNPFKVITSPPPAFQRLINELADANYAAVEQVKGTVIDTQKAAVARGASPQAGFDKALEDYFEREVNFLIESRQAEFDELVGVRGADFDPTARRRIIERREQITRTPEDLVASDKAAADAKMQAYREVYGDEAVNKFLEDNNLTDLSQMTQALDEELRTTMASFSEYTARRSAWDYVLTQYFGAERISSVYRGQAIDEALKIDVNAPLSSNNIKPLSIEDLREVVDRIRVSDPSLKGKGLIKRGVFVTEKGVTTSEDAIIAPLIEYMISIQRRSNINPVVDALIKEESGIGQSLYMAAYGRSPMELGGHLDLPEANVGQGLINLETEIKGAINDFNNNYNLPKPLATDDIILAFRERLLSGVERDLILNQTRAAKQRGMETLLSEMIKQNTLAPDMKLVANQLFDSGAFTSRAVESAAAKVQDELMKTVTGIEKRKDIRGAKQGEILKAQQVIDSVEDGSYAGITPVWHDSFGRINLNEMRALEAELPVLKERIKGLEEKAATLGEASPAADELMNTKLAYEGKFNQLTDLQVKYAEAYDTAVNRIIANQRGKIQKANKAIQQYEAFLEAAPEVQKLSEDLARKIVRDFKEQYIMRLSFSANGNQVSLLGDQVQNLKMFFDTYGMNGMSVGDYLRTNGQRIFYIGDSRIAMTYGDDIAQQVREMTELASSSEFATKMDALMKTGQVEGKYVVNTILNLFSGIRRWQISHMLGGGFLPAIRFFGMNRITAPHIFFTTVRGINLGTALKFTGTAVGGLPASIINGFSQSVRGKPITAWLDHNKFLYAPANKVIVKAGGNVARDITAGELREAATYYGIEFSRTNIEFYEATFDQMLADFKLTYGGKSRYKAEGTGFWGTAESVDKFRKRMWDKIDPTMANIWSQVAQYQDAELRRLVFLEAVKQGVKMEDAAELAKRSMLDYNSLSKIEREYIARPIFFYAFMRSMGAEMVNGLYRAMMSPNLIKGKIVPKMIRAQDELNRITAEDYYALTNQQLSRIYNIFHGTVDGVDLYQGGAINPQMQMFEFLCNSVFYMGAGGKKLYKGATLVTEDPIQAAQLGVEGTYDALLKGIFEAVLTGKVQGSPVGEYFRKRYLTDLTKERLPSFPVEIIHAAEQEGKLPELVQMYHLVPKQYKSAARPLTAEGTQWSFDTKTKEGRKGYVRFLNHQIIALSTTAIGYELGLTRLGFIPTGQQSRATADLRKAAMVSEQAAIDVPSPTGQGTIQIPTRAAYLKSKTQQDDMVSNFWESQEAYWTFMSGFTTPTQSTPTTQRYEYHMRSMLRELEALEKQYVGE